MATAYNPTPDNTVTTLNTQAEKVMEQGKAAYDQVASKSKDALDKGMKSIEDYNTMARDNLEAIVASSKIAAKGFEAIGQHIAAVSKKNFEATVAAAKSMSTVKTPQEFMTMQSDFAKAQFETAVSDFSKLSETLVKLAGEVVEPISNRVAVAVDKIKTAAHTN